MLRSLTIVKQRLDIIIRAILTTAGTDFHGTTIKTIKKIPTRSLIFNDKLTNTKKKGGKKHPNNFIMSC